ncbi:MAG: hypothetical protein ACRBF0_05360 [Calditrichia bacterium]
MTQKKRLKKIVTAVKKILGDNTKVKKLKKANALKSFIEKMIKKRQEIKKTLAKGKLKKDRESELVRNLETLSKQIKKAKKVLEKIEA